MVGNFSADFGSGKGSLGRFFRRGTVRESISAACSALFIILWNSAVGGVLYTYLSTYLPTLALR